jgi:hypothetical protein
MLAIRTPRTKSQLRKSLANQTINPHALPHARSPARLCELHYDSRGAADEKRERVLEHAPRYRVGRHKRGLASGLRKIDRKIRRAG